MRSYRVITTDGVRGPYQESTILKGIRRGLIPLGARLELTTSGRTMYARDVQREAEIRAHTLSSARELLSAAGTSIPPAVRSTAGANRPSRNRKLLASAIGTAVVLVVVLIATWAVGSIAPEADPSNAVIGDNPKEEVTARGTEAEEATTLLRQEVLHQREELEQLRRQLNQDTANRSRLEAELAASGSNASDDGVTPSEVEPPELDVSELPGFSDYAEQYNPSIFLIYTEIPLWDGEGVKKGTYAGVGTGWLVAPGLIVTNKHVLFSFLFDPVRSRALDWLVREDGWRMDAEAGIIAAFPTGSTSPQSSPEAGVSFASAWVHDGETKTTASRGRLYFEGALPDVLKAETSTLGTREVTTFVHDGESANDLVLLRISGGGAENLKPLPLASTSDLEALKQLDEVMTIGFPYGLRVSRGRVLQTSPALGHIRHHEADRRVLVTSASVHPGNSGGPLVLRNGTVVGVVTRGFESDLNESIDVGRVHELLDSSNRIEGRRYFESLRARFSPPAQQGSTGTGPRRSSEVQPRLALQISWLQDWYRLKVGMTQEDVTEVLGQPGEEGDDQLAYIWRYPDRNGARVFFDKEHRLVTRWTTPWSRLREGMSQTQVERLLRAPNERTRSERNEAIWFYRFEGELYGVLFDHAGKLSYHNFPS